MALLPDPPGRVRPAGDVRLDEGRAALCGRDRGETVTGTENQGRVPRVGLVQDAQRHLHGERLAAGSAAVRFERMPEPAVIVAVRGHRVPHRSGRLVAEQPLEPAPVDHPRVRGDEGGGSIEVRSVHRSIMTAAPPYRIERNGHRRGMLTGWMAWRTPPLA